MARLHYFVHGRGRGHATRTLSIVERLRGRGHEISVSAGSSAVPMLRPFCETRSVPSLPPRLTWGSATALARRVAGDVAILRREAAELVVSDGDLPGLLAAKIVGVPSIAVGHGLAFSRCRRPEGIDRVSWWREALKAELSTLGAGVAVAVNFVPLQTRRRRTVLSRPALDRALVRRAETGPIVCYFRDGAPQVLRALAASDEPIVLFAPADPRIENMQWRPMDREGFVRALGTTRAVVATAGSQLISECVAMGIPMFALHDPRDDEQRLNVAMLRKYGLGDGVPFDQFDLERLRRFLARSRGGVGSSWSAPTADETVCQWCETLLGEPAWQA